MEFASNKNMTGNNSICRHALSTLIIAWQWEIRTGQSILHPNWLETANQLQQILIYSWWTWQSILNLPTKIDYSVPSPQKLIASNPNRA